MQHWRHVISIATTAHIRQDTLQRTEVAFIERGMERGQTISADLEVKRPNMHQDGAQQRNEGGGQATLDLL